MSKTYSQQLLTALQQHDFSQSNLLLKKAFASDDPETLEALANSLSDLGLTDLAAKTYRHLLELDSRNDEVKVYLAEILFDDGQDDAALNLLYDVQTDSPAYVQSLLVQADYYQSAGLIETAKNKLTQASQLAPEEPAITFGLAELAYSSGDYQTALPLYQKLLKTQTAVAEVSLTQRVIACLAKLGDYEQAAELLKQHKDAVLDIDSQYQAGLILLQAKDYHAAEHYFDEVLRQSPDYVNAYPLLTQAYLADNDPDNALAAARTGLTYNEYDETLYSLGASAALKLGEQGEAQHLLEKGLKVAPDNQELTLQLSNLYLQTGQDEKNIALLKHLQEDSREPQVYWNLGRSELRQDDLKSAQADLLLAYPSFKEQPDFLRDLIAALRATGQRQALLEVLQKYVQLVPDDLDMQELLADLETEA
ncbi:MAG: tetratricopeptide repeat protein [Lactobacillus sp.]|jgi:tetratricopeptide (TPR) repeat protein|nr:tetratricopeptide repeat protein [Lactobacillus sp.]MCH3906407.1 tetratricopeptide repeat protein [Lactobacillus sp.]MCH3990018.1 tetratricopeptide repeat protein [Lactobacillus sp.]MCH4069268.1 tetratricopeptide repeat protein [Lactobacillus sp.]MCI1303570.1 tetratricopeptide repeat protein [Lactobacillus sp.]